MFIFRRKKGRTRKTAPFTGIGNLIPQFLADITGDHSCISGEYRFNAQLPHSGNDLLLQCFLLPIPTVGIRSAPSFQIIHLPPCHKGRTGINSLISSVVYPIRFSRLYQTTSIPVILKGILMPCIAIQSISFSQRSQSQKAME